MSYFYVHFHAVELIVACAILTIANTKLALASLCPGEKCEYNIKVIDSYSYFNMHGIQLATLAKQITIETTNSSECYVNTADVLENFSFTDDSLVAVLVFVCKKELLVHFTPFDQSKHINVIGYLHIGTCSISYESIEQLSRTMDIRVVGLSNNKLSEPCNDAPKECQGLREIASLAYHNYQDSPQNLTKIFSCTDIFPELAEVAFRNMLWREIPSFLRERLINLQALEIPHSNLTVPPYFPWRKEEQKLPRNLSRTRYFQNYYSESFHIEISASIFRRYLNLDYNHISDLSDFSFHGYLHILTITNNHLIHIGVQTFRNVSGLQHLDLSENELEHIPIGIFDGLVTLRYLKLQNNKIHELRTGTFNDLQSITYLNLANNFISLLPKGLFSRLEKLQVLYLEYNNISVIDTEAFPVNSIALKSVYLNNNPLLSIPEFIFWIKSLSLIVLRSTLISFRNFGDYIDSIEYERLRSTIVESVHRSDIDLGKKGEIFRLVDLTNARVENICIDNMTLQRKQILELMIKNYHFKLSGNPLTCSCYIISFQRFIYDLLKNNSIEGDEYYFTDWKCESPVELRGRKMLDVKPEETYCSINVSGCPEDCSCYKRSINLNVIVDCRWRNVSELHDVMPQGHLELWYSGNKITKLNNMEYLWSVKVLDLSNNSISKLEISATSNLKSVQKLFLHSNLLASLPENIADIRFENLTLNHNPFKCDCRTLWMKDWMVKRKSTINDWSDITCNDVKVEGKLFLLVPDDNFVCEEDTLRHVIISTVASTVILLLVIVILVIVYVYRFECKVILYIYFGVHPFDKDTAKDEEADAVIVHSGKLTDWVMNHIVDILEGGNYNFRVCDMARDFVIGFTFQENLNQVARHSKRIILIISEDWKTDDETFKVAWNIAQEKIKESKSNFGIIIIHGVTSKQIKDKALLRFIKRGRCIESRHRLFVEKILYSMPMKNTYSQNRKPNTKSLIQREFSINEGQIDDNRIHAYVSYSDQDLEFVTKELAPQLERRGYRLCLPDRDFIPGASKEENILKAIDISLRTVFVLSGSHLKDEWSLFTFITACEKSLREKTNYLIVILREDVELASMDTEVRHYLKTYISLDVNDRWFWSKLFNGLPFNGQRHDCRDPSPLVTSKCIVSN